MSLGARLLNVFAIPGDVFAEVKATPPAPANWVVPALLLIVVSWVSVWLVFSQPTIQHQIIEAGQRSIEKTISKNHIPKEKADAMNQAVEKYAVIGAQISGAVWVVLSAFAVPFCWGLILWLVGVKVFKGQFSYMKAVEVAGLAAAIEVLAAVVRTLLIVGLDNFMASPSAALLVKDFDPQKPSHALLATANIMSFWVLMVRAVGLGKLSGVPLSRAALWVFGIWALYMSLWLGFGIAMQGVAR